MAFAPERAPFGAWQALRRELLWARVRERSTPLPEKRPFEEYAAWFVLRGEARHRAAGREARARAGEWLLPPLGWAEQSFAPGTRLLSLRFRFTYADGSPGIVFPSRSSWRRPRRRP